MSFKHRSTSLSSISKTGNSEASKPRCLTQMAFNTAKYRFIPICSNRQSNQSQSILLALTKNPQSSTCLRLMSTEAKCSALCLRRYRELKRTEGYHTFFSSRSSVHPSLTSPSSMRSISAVERCPCTFRND